MSPPAPVRALRVFVCENEGENERVSASVLKVASVLPPCCRTNPFLVHSGPSMCREVKRFGYQFLVDVG
jgi:hypothetical protein